MITSAADQMVRARVLLEVQAPIAQQLLSDHKQVETRRYALPAELLGAPITLVESPAGTAGVSALPDVLPPAQPGLAVAGTVRFTECVAYADEAAWRADAHRHLCDAGGGYGWPEEGGVFGWVVGERAPAAPAGHESAAEPWRVVLEGAVLGMELRERADRGDGEPEVRVGAWSCEGGAAEASGRIPLGSLVLGVGGAPTAGLGVEAVLGLVRGAARPIELSFGTPSVPAMRRVQRSLFVELDWKAVTASLNAGVTAEVAQQQQGAVVAAAPPRIDSHMHLWGGDLEHADHPSPPELDGSYEALEAALEAAGLDVAVVVQPINYGFNHAPVAAALAAHPERLRGMALADPALGPAEAVAELQSLAAQGFRGVRFNPGLGSAGWMAGPTGLALYAKCGELGFPVGVMAFTGLLKVAADVDALLAASPSTPLIIDHWGFFVQPPVGGNTPWGGGAWGDADEAAWERLLAWGREHEQVHVKVSADFRVSVRADTEAVGDMRAVLLPRARALLAAFGARRLMWGSDFPWVADEGGGHAAAAKAAEALWREATGGDEGQMGEIFGGTAGRLFGVGE